jgi:hypothetical protein
MFFMKQDTESREKYYWEKFEETIETNKGKNEGGKKERVIFYLVSYLLCLHILLLSDILFMRGREKDPKRYL